MKSLFQLSLLTLCLLQIEAVSAHAVVTDYSLKIAPIHANQAEKVELTFNSQVELGLSQIFLVRKGDQHELLKATKGQKNGLIIVEVPPLAPGDYAIRFKVFAADGHLTEDVIHFAVSQ
ncbi:copper resistance CopC family protein [Methylobacter sp. YRD-M1]|uniref:copper resistance CopC family protein n=1 Tax=Methylobacter sp. YRD-M1 TaxID=2911520 RepID=UPI00227C2A20|nr:copper resistance CopC family protein [Methylobacter sp. YRD-M1]WAK03698.1 copper resistance protein CopC [Methylobacter sp. YRD-M1]